MKNLTSAQATIKLVNLCKRIDRIIKNEYSNKRFLTSDKNKLIYELENIHEVRKIASLNINKERATKIIIMSVEKETEITINLKLTRQVYFF